VNWLVTKNGANKEVAIKMGGNMRTAQYFVPFKEKDSEKFFGDDSTLWVFLVSGSRRRGSGGRRRDIGREEPRKDGGEGGGEVGWRGMSREGRIGGHEEQREKGGKRRGRVAGMERNKKRGRG
jgi:hypothetical protein